MKRKEMINFIVCNGRFVDGFHCSSELNLIEMSDSEIKVIYDEVYDKVNHLKRYKNWSPSQFDSKGLNADTLDIGEFYVLPILHQPKLSGQLLNKANFDSALKILGGESEKVQVHYFGHWASDFEIIVVSPELIEKVQEIENALADYPILDDEYYYQLEYDALNDLWDNIFTFRDRKRLILEYNERYNCNISMNQAKRKYANLNDGIQEYFRDMHCNEL